MPPSTSELRVGDLVETTMSTWTPTYSHPALLVQIIGDCSGCADVKCGRVFPLGKDVYLHMNHTKLVYREPLS